MPLLKNRPKIDLWYQYLSNSYKPNRLKLETILFSSSHPKTKKQKKPRKPNTVCRITSIVHKKLILNIINLNPKFMLFLIS